MNKKVIFSIGTIGISAAPIGMAVSCSTASVVKTPITIDTTIKSLESENHVLSGTWTKQNEINVYFPFLTNSTYEMLRHAMISEGENHFYYWNGLLANIDVSYFNNFLRNKRVGLDGQTISSQNSIAKKINGVQSVFGEVESLIKANPDKVVNLYLEDYAYFLDYYRTTNYTENSFKQIFENNDNVILRFFQHGENYSADTTKVLATEQAVLNNGLKSDLTISPPYANRFQKVFSVSTDPRIVHYGMFNPNETIGLEDSEATKSQDEIFSRRDSDGTRYMTAWSKINNFSYKEVKDAVDAAHSESKKTLFIIGSYRQQGEKEFIEKLWEKYHDTYRIFYKGHPGHNEVSNWVSNILNSKIADDKEKVFVINPSIPSEDLTQLYVDEFHFDSFATVGESGALKGLNNGITTPNDLIEIYVTPTDGSDYGTVETVNSPIWQTLVDKYFTN